MGEITIESLKDGNIELCRDLCNELMKFQQMKAHILPEVFNFMNFDTRMKASYESSLANEVIIVKDDGVPVGYSYVNIELVENVKSELPEWFPMKDDNMKGFYPEWLTFPQKVGCLSNLYLKEGYRKSGLGAKLFDMSMEWLESFDDVSLIFIYISNGNDDAYHFYLKHGFTYSHDVFGQFIKAVYKKK